MTDERERDSNPATCTWGVFGPAPTASTRCGWTKRRPRRVERCTARPLWVVFAKGRGVVRCGAHARNLLDALERTRVPRHVCALPRAVRS